MVIEKPQYSQNYQGNASNNVETKKRGWLLTTYSILVILSFIYTSYTFIFQAETISGIIPSGSLLIYQIISVLGIIFGIAMFNLKKWGVYGFIGIAIVGLILNSLASSIIFSIIFFIIGVGILLLIIKSRWKYFN